MIRQSSCYRSRTRTALSPINRLGIAVLLTLSSLAGSPVSAQWLKQTTTGIPRTADGKPNLAEPVREGPFAHRPTEIANRSLIRTTSDSAAFIDALRKATGAGLPRGPVTPDDYGNPTSVTLTVSIWDG
jgi:hypothetical protein